MQKGGVGWGVGDMYRKMREIKWSQSQHTCYRKGFFCDACHLVVDLFLLAAGLAEVPPDVADLVFKGEAVVHPFDDGAVLTSELCLAWDLLLLLQQVEADQGCAVRREELCKVQLCCGIPGVTPAELDGWTQLGRLHEAGLVPIEGNRVAHLNKTDAATASGVDCLREAAYKHNLSQNITQ